MGLKTEVGGPRDYGEGQSQESWLRSWQWFATGDSMFFSTRKGKSNISQLTQHLTLAHLLNPKTLGGTANRLVNRPIWNLSPLVLAGSPSQKRGGER